MTNLNEFTKAFPVDQKTFEDGFKTWAGFGERISGITIDAATTSNETAARSAQETFANLRDVATVRTDPAEYGRAFADFARKQSELALRTAEAFGGVIQTAQTSTTELASNAGAEAASATTATRKSAKATKKAA